MAAPGVGTVDACDDDGKECTCGSYHEQFCLYCRRKRSSTSGLPSSSSSCSLMSFDSYPVQDYDKLWRVFTASVKGFSIGTGLKGGLALFALFSRIRRRRSLPSSRKVEMSSVSADVVLALKETLRYGLFLGTFAGTFVSVDEIVTSLGGHRRTAKWRALLAGAIAGPSMLITGLNTQHTSLAIYILMRATVLASRCGIKSKRFGHICKPLTWSHGDILLMCLSSSQILYGNQSFIDERHRHRYEVNPDVVLQLEDAGLTFTGKDESGRRMEIVELPSHPYFVGVQFHPEFKSRPGKPSALFLGLVAAACGHLDVLLKKVEAKTCRITNGSSTAKAYAYEKSAKLANGSLNGIYRNGNGLHV